MNEDLQEICDEFVTESRETLDQVEPRLVGLEQDCDSSVVDEIFRAFHSMKGSAGFLGFESLVALTHEAESLLDRFRSGSTELRPNHVTLLCDALDLSKRMLDQVESEHHDHGFEDQVMALVAELKASGESASVNAENPPPPPAVDETGEPVCEGRASERAPELFPEPAPDTLAVFNSEAPQLLSDVDAALRRLAAAPDDAAHLDVAFAKLHRFKSCCGMIGSVELERVAHGMECLLVELRRQSSTPEPGQVASLLAALETIRTSLTAGPQDCAERSPPAAIATAPAPSPQLSAPAAKTRNAEKSQPASGKPPSRGNVRVDLEKLDLLMDLVGELIISETMVTHNPDLEDYEFENFQKASLQLNRITRSLQDVAMGVRMVPIGSTFRKMVRVVRDLATKQEKQIELDITGEDTEVDKTVVEAIADPLVHMIRNSADHGIEMPAERAAKGKPPCGTIRLSASHEAGEIWIVIQDDGKGIDRSAILAKARSNGLIEGSGDQLRDDEVFQLIFEPGFSTAAAVSDISGRGVGMDVVRRNIEALKGRIEIASELGRGSRFTIRIPLTLAIIEGMLVRLGESTYTIPLLSIRESIRAEAGWITQLTDGTEMVNLRGELVQVLRLHRIFELQSDHTELYEGILVIVEESGTRLALLVDEVVGQRQTVIKALPRFLSNPVGLSGCSILSSGEISLILDVAGVVQRYRSRSPEIRQLELESAGGMR